MSRICAYFLAASNHEAEQLLGPGPTPAPHHPVVDAPGVGPDLELLELDEILTGTSFEDLLEQDAGDSLTEDLEHPEQAVYRVRESLLHALANAEDEAIGQAAVAWAATDELASRMSAADCGRLIRDLAGLAERALESDQHLYCRTA